MINHETATRVPVDEEGAILYNIFNADFYIINNEKSPKEALKILIQKHKIVKDVFENIVIYRRKNELENIDSRELKALKQLAAIQLAWTDEQLAIALQHEKLFEVIDHD